MIKVLHLRDTDRVCGPGKTIIETARAATTDFHHVVGLLLLAREKQNLYQEAAEKRGVEVVPIRSAHQLDPRVVATLARVIRDEKIDVVHSHDYKSDLLAWTVSRLRRIPIMTTVHGWIWNNVRYRIYWKAAQSVLPKFDLVVAVSGETRSAVLKCGVPEEKVKLIHNAIVAENYDPARVQRGSVRQRWNIPADAPLVGCIGRLSYEKGQRDLLQAAAQVLKTHPDTWFLFAGDGPDRPNVEQLASELGIAQRVILTGHLADVRPIFRDIDLLALTSHTEGFPNVILESLCMGTPVLATDVGGVREIVRDGETGVLLPAHQPDRIAASLKQLLDGRDWAKQMAAAGKALVMQQFTFQQRVRKEEDVCRQMLAAWQS